MIIPLHYQPKSFDFVVDQHTVYVVTTQSTPAKGPINNTAIFYTINNGKIKTIARYSRPQTIGSDYREGQDHYMKFAGFLTPSLVKNSNGLYFGFNFMHLAAYNTFGIDYIYKVNPAEKSIDMIGYFPCVANPALFASGKQLFAGLGFRDLSVYQYAKHSWHQLGKPFGANPKKPAIPLGHFAFFSHNGKPYATASLHYYNNPNAYLSARTHLSYFYSYTGSALNWKAHWQKTDLNQLSAKQRTLIPWQVNTHITGKRTLLTLYQPLPHTKAVHVTIAGQCTNSVVHSFQKQLYMMCETKHGELVLTQESVGYQ